MKKIERKLNKEWKHICNELSFPSHIKQNSLTNNSSLPKFYCLIKTHKNSPSIKIRPIVANIDSPTTKLSWFLSRILKPLLNSVPAHLENSLNLINNINRLDDTEKKVFFIHLAWMWWRYTHPSLHKKQS